MQIAERIRSYVKIGLQTVIAEMPVPCDVETTETLIRVVKPMVES